MIDSMLTQEELEVDCPTYIDDLEAFLGSHKMKDSPEAMVYVLAQLLHEKLNDLECELEQKGAIVTNVIGGLVEFNGEPLAAYRDLKKMIEEQKTGTVH